MLFSFASPTEYSLVVICDIGDWVCKVSYAAIAPHRQLIICSDR